MRVLCGEPFCYTPREAARVTDYQFWELVVKPALRRNRRGRSGGGGRGGGKGGGRLPTRAEYVATGAALGGDRAELGRAYDEWRAKHGRDAG